VFFGQPARVEPAQRRTDDGDVGFAAGRAPRIAASAWAIASEGETLSIGQAKYFSKPQARIRSCTTRDLNDCGEERKPCRYSSMWIPGQDFAPSASSSF
jgi:hypothetical protein